MTILSFVWSRLRFLLIHRSLYGICAFRLSQTPSAPSVIGSCWHSHLNSIYQIHACVCVCGHNGSITFGWCIGSSNFTFILFINKIKYNRPIVCTHYDRSFVLSWQSQIFSFILTAVSSSVNIKQKKETESWKKNQRE